MSYASQELSQDSGQPVELYQFIQNGEVWNYTSAAEAITHNAVTYKPSPIIRQEINQSSEIAKATLVLKMPRDHEVGSKFVGVSPDFITTVTIFRLHITDSGNELVTYWKGRVLQAKANGSEVDVECDSVFSSMQRMGLRATYQRTCRHALYSGNCGLNINSYAVNATVSGGTTTAVQVATTGTYADGYFTGGIAKTVSGAMRFIVAHASGAITLSRPFDEDITIGDGLVLYPGCDHSKATCISKFDNLLNFGGFPYIPNINPFGGSSIT